LIWFNRRQYKNGTGIEGILIIIFALVLDLYLMEEG
jgi:hypothetical protein